MAAVDRDAVKIAVIMLTLNQRSMTLRCLASLLAIKAPPFRILLWDNGSDDDTISAVQSAFPEVVVHYHPSNLGVAAGRNAAAKLAIEAFKPTHLLFLDNDMDVEPGFVGELLRPFAGEERLGQTQAKLRFMDDRQRLNDGGGARIEFLRGRITPVGYGEIDHGQYDQPRMCVSCGGAMMVRTDVFQELGGFDDEFNPFGPEDLDFSLRLAKAGYYALYIPTALAYHVANHTFGNGYTEDYARHKLRLWFLFMRRHASLWQQLGFLLLAAPYLVVRVAVREGRRGNLRAFRGLARGMVDFVKSMRVTLRRRW